MADTTTLDLFGLGAFPQDNGVALISPPQSFEGGEGAYDQNIGRADAGALRSGQGAIALAKYYARRPLDAILEIGAGSGTCTMGLLRAAPNAAFLITDTSPVFLGMIERKLAASETRAARSYATLSGEDLGKLPPASVDAIIVASALHHVSDWRAFIADARRALREGGVLLVQEPMREGNLLMAAVISAALVPDALTRAFPKRDLQKLADVRDYTYLASNTHIEKLGEDKHSFLADELFSVATAAGFTSSAMLRNAHFEAYAELDGAPRESNPVSLMSYLRSYLADHHRVSAPALDELQKRVFPAFDGLEQTFARGDGPAFVGLMAMRA